MQAQPLVTIVTPSYNQAAFLEITMLSVLEQDYPKLEYWVIDGGSSDASVEIIKKYEGRLAGWVSEKDRGQADGVNKGFARANGEIVGWLNSDDLYYPGAVSQAVEAFRAHPEASFVFSDVESIDSKGKPFNLMRYGDWKLPDLMSFKIIGQPGVFMRRAVLEEAGYLDLSYNYLLDVQLWMKMAALAEPFYVPGTVWAAARMHADAKNAAQSAGFGPEAFRLAKWLCEDPRFYPLSAQNFKRIWAGAHRINAFYQVEAGNFGEGLRSYAQMLRYQPGSLTANLPRIAYALLSKLGLRKVRSLYDQAHSRRYAERNFHPGRQDD